MTGFVWNANHVEHDVEGHPECPERLESVLALLRDCGLLERLHRIEPRDATDEELWWVHTPAYVRRVDDVCAQGGGWFDPDTYALPRSCEAARRACGSSLDATEAVLSGRTRSAFAAVRPPGHHARPAQAMGFCLYNNIAVAAQYARERHGLERVAIIDIDVHHGNGTQDAFYGDPGVLYVSTHQYPFYPGTGPAEETGAGTGAGANVNIPLQAGCGDREYALAFEQVVEPVVARYRPQIVLVSCGFDAHYADPLAGMALSVDGYGDMAERILALAEELCDGKLVYFLEGGYDFTAVSWGVRRVLETLLSEPQTPDPLGPLGEGPSPHVEPVLRELRELHGLT
ncbi:MAG: histone deacetylase [Dehalococcoidia bacterium]